MSDEIPSPLVREQLDALDLSSTRPLIVSDADEVLLQFITSFENYLERKNLWLDLQSFALTGNIKYRDTNAHYPEPEVPALLSDFFETETENLKAVPDAAQTLSALSQRAQIVVLSNVPVKQKTARRKNLARQGMDYPVIANSGLKGAAIRHLADRVEAPLFFLDDIPRHIFSVARAHAACHRIHFIADARLAKLIPAAQDSHLHTSSWQEAGAFIEKQLGEAGY